VPARGIRGKWCATAQANHEVLESRLRLADHADVTVLQPNAAAKLQTEVAQSRKPRREEVCLRSIRSLVRESRITHAADGMELEVAGNLAALLDQEQGRNT
jgi:hypothetical protein